MSKIKLLFFFIVLLGMMSSVVLSADNKKKKKKEDSVIVKNLKEHAKKAREEIKTIKDKIKPLKKWIKDHRTKWYPEQVYARSLIKTIRKKNKEIRDLLLDSLRETEKKAELYRKTMGIKKKYLKHLSLYLYYLTTKESPEKEQYSKFIFNMAKSSNTLKKCVICYNLVKILNFISKKKYMEKLNKILKKAAGSKKKSLNIITGMKPVVKNLVTSGKSSDTFKELFMEVKVVRKLKKSLKSKTLYYQKKVIKVKKISIYKRRIRNIQHIYYRMVGAENKREKAELQLQMKRFAKYTALKVRDLSRQRARIHAAIIMLKKKLRKVNLKLKAVKLLSFKSYLAQRNSKKSSSENEDVENIQEQEDYDEDD